MKDRKQIVIVGGKLQGAEAAYLCREAGIKVILIDSNPDAPARFLCDEFLCADVLSDSPEITSALEESDMVLPTMENYEVLDGMVKLCERKGYILAFDWDAYCITSSKKASDSLFVREGLPCPKYYPEGDFPYIAKPDSESGSHGVFVIEGGSDPHTALKCLGGLTPSPRGQTPSPERAVRDGWIVQEFLEGPSYSVEIIGEPGNYRVYVPTEIFVDEVYDCNLAAVHRNIETEKVEKINECIIKTAVALSLRGIMDIEVIDQNGTGDIRVLEVDARLPSQTSVAVYEASGMNYIEELYDLFCSGGFTKPQTDKGFCSSYTQYLIDGGRMTSPGEHIMVEGGVLRFSDELSSYAKAVTDFAEGKSTWRGIFVSRAESLEKLHDIERKTQQEILQKTL